MFHTTSDGAKEWIVKSRHGRQTLKHHKKMVELGTQIISYCSFLHYFHEKQLLICSLLSNSFESILIYVQHHVKNSSTGSSPDQWHGKVHLLYCKAKYTCSMAQSHSNEERGSFCLPWLRNINSVSGM